MIFFQSGVDGFVGVVRTIALFAEGLCMLLTMESQESPLCLVIQLPQASDAARSSSSPLDNVLSILCTILASRYCGCLAIYYCFIHNVSIAIRFLSSFLYFGW